jgi:hypothetical protein
MRGYFKSVTLEIQLPGSPAGRRACLPAFRVFVDAERENAFLAQTRRYATTYIRWNVSSSGDLDMITLASE